MFNLSYMDFQWVDNCLTTWGLLSWQTRSDLGTQGSVTAPDLEFYGVEDPAEADEWTVKIEKIFKVFKCTGKHQV